MNMAQGHVVCFRDSCECIDTRCGISQFFNAPLDAGKK